MIRADANSKLPRVGNIAVVFDSENSPQRARG
jgi:hypothetical protein